MSLLTSVRLPYLRRSEAPGTVSKAPLLTLNFSSHSLLDSTLKDDASLSPLYTITTVGATTTIVRDDPRQKPIKTASIKWPRIVPAKNKSKSTLDGVLVQLKGQHWSGGDSFLRPSTFKSGSRKFDLPYYSHSMKWQKQGAVYWCNSTPVKGPIAVFNPPVDELPARLSVYETLYDEHNIGPMLLHQGVSVFLLDHLLITAILLVCDPQEWIAAQSASSSAISSGDVQSTASLQTAHREPFLSQPTLQRFDTAPSQMLNKGSLPPQARPELKSVLSFSSNSDNDVTCSGSPGSASHAITDQSLNCESWPTERNALLSQNDKRSTFISENHITESSVGPSSLPSSLRKRRPSEPAMRAYSVRRPLPQTPAALGGDNHVIRRVQSHVRSHESIGFRRPWTSTSPPPLPPIPRPATSGTGRCLPPTPFDLSTGGSMGGSNMPMASGVQVHRKSFDSDEDNPRWIQLLGGGEGRSGSVLPRTSFEQFPPAYSSLDFSDSRQGS